MDYEQITQAFEQVIEMSYNDQHKLKNHSVAQIFDAMKDQLREFLTQNGDLMSWQDTLKKFIALVRARRPGYVIQDIYNIIMLGFGGQLTEDMGFYADTLKKWFWDYGIRKVEGQTKRNQWLDGAASVMKKRTEKITENDHFNGKSFSDLRNEPDFAEKYPTLKAVTEGTVKVGKQID